MITEIKYKAHGFGINEACADMQNDFFSESDTNWVLYRTQKRKGKGYRFEPVGSGDSGLTGLLAAMEENESEILFGSIGVGTEDNAGSVRIKYLYFSCLPVSGKVMEKPAIGTKRGVIDGFFLTKHITMNFASDDYKSYLTSDNISKQFLSVGGAHKPARYNFHDGQVFEVPPSQ